MTDVLDEVKKLLTEHRKESEEYRKVNDARIAEIESGGSADPVLVEKQQKAEASIEAIEKQIDELKKIAARPQDNIAGSTAITPVQQKHVDAFEAWLRKPDKEGGERRAALMQAASETRAIDSQTTSVGHAIPEVIGARIQRTLEQASPMRSLVNVITVGSPDYKEIVDRNGATGGWVGESDTRTGTDEPSIAQVAPTFGEVYARPEAFEHILDDAFFDVSGWLVTSVVRKLAELEGIAFISGNGSNRPTGFLAGTPEAAADFDLSPARTFQELQYLPTGVAANFQADSLGSPAGEPFGVFLDTIHALRPGWRMGARWVMSTDTKGQLRRMRDGDGRYLMGNGSIEGGETNEIFGYGISEMDHMPGVAANAFPVAFGNFQEGYLACERTTLRITIDDNITTPGTVKFFVRRRLGGCVRQDQAIKLIKCATS